MLERLGYELLTAETATDLLAIKDGRKHVVAFAATTDQLPTQANHLSRLHQTIIATNAAGGFYVTTRGFSRDAEAFAKTAPIKLVDGPKLVASIKHSMQGIPAPDSYKAMRRECGAIVAHRLDKAEAIACSSGHAVAL
jgi:restriction endonuclease